MKAKDFMLQIKKLDKMIENKLAEREQWLSMATSTTAAAAPETGVRVQTSGSKQQMENAIARFIDLEKEIDECIDRLIDEKRLIIKTIEQLSEAEYDVLHQLYIQGNTLQEIADKRDCSYSNITTIHGRALQNLQKILDKEETKEGAF